MSIENTIKKIIFKFIKIHEEEINLNKFEDLYMYLNKNYTSLRTISAFTQVLLDAGINPIPYFTDIPRSFAAHLNLDKVDLPEGIYTIGVDSFFGSQINELHLPHSLIEVLDQAFLFSEINKVTYNGTKDEFYSIKGWDSSYLLEAAQQIECKDGVIENENH